MAVSSLDYLWVAAIDFGTTFSGYAFGWREELEENPTKTSAPVWQAADGGLISSKTPTTVLLDKDEQLVDFGFDAETAYAELSENEEHEDYFYFRRFKMMLYDKVRKSVSKPIYGGIFPLVRYFMLTCEIFMSSCQILMLTCEIFLLTCHLFIS